MCEIHLVSDGGKPLTEQDIDTMFDMLEVGSYHNKHAWGLFCNNFIIRRPGSFFEFKHKDWLRRKLLQHQVRFIVGHNRFATQGNPEENQNNHPFKLKNLTMVHNGIIFNDEELKKQFKLNYNEETDSAIVIHLIDYFMKQDLKTSIAIKKTAELLEGYFSIFVYNHKEDRLYYFRNADGIFSSKVHYLKSGRSVLVGSRSEQRLEDTYKEDRKRRYNNIIKDNTVYLVKSNTFRPLCTFEEKVREYLVDEDVMGSEDKDVEDVEDIKEEKEYQPFFIRKFKGWGWKR